MNPTTGSGAGWAGGGQLPPFAPRDDATALQPRSLPCSIAACRAAVVGAVEGR